MKEDFTTSGPFFSIIIPTFNRAHIIEKTISSLLNQTFLDYEIIVIDDGSTDNTKEVLMPYISENFHYLWQENAERNVARNNGTKHAKGKYINWFDSDDIALPNHLLSNYNFIKSNNFPSVIHSLYNVIDTNGIEIRKKNEKPQLINNILYKGNCLSTNNIIVKKTIAKEYLFNEDQRLLAEDYELWLRIAAQYQILENFEHTTSIVYHEERSVLTVKNKNKLITGYTLFLNLIDQNSFVTSYLEDKYDYFKMKTLLILSVELAVNNYKKEAIYYLFKAFRANRKCLFQKTFYATLKYIIF